MIETMVASLPNVKAAFLSASGKWLAVVEHLPPKRPDEELDSVPVVSESDQWPSLLCRSKHSPQNEI
jgi:hypothetical protein